MLNEYEELTLRALAKDFVEQYEDDMSGQCGYCLWTLRAWQPTHDCLWVEVAGIVKSWEEDGTLADD